MKLWNHRYTKTIPVLVGLAALDLWSKHWMGQFLAHRRSVTLIPGCFQLTLAHNTGAAFSIGRTWSMPVFLVLSVVAMAVVGYLFYRLDEKEKWSMWGLTFILAGAIGNLVDRVRFGYVVDFLDAFVGKYHWPVFNLADSMITVGAILFAIDLIWPPILRKTEKK